MSKKSFRLGPFQVFVGVFALVWLLISILPFYYMILSSFKQRFEVLGGGVFALPRKPSMTNYATALAGGFLRYLLNSIVVVSLSLLLIILVSAAASYVFSRLKFRINKVLFAFVVALMAIPIHVTLIPVFMLTQTMGTYDTIWSMIGPYVAFNLPISIFILSGFMVSIPHELEEAGELDGCDKLGLFIRVIFPLSVPGMATIAIFDGVNLWNEFVFAMVLTQSVKSRTLPLAVWEFQGQYTSNTVMTMTVLTLTALPMILAFIIFQERLIKGMMAGAVKG
jgi:raffinose/stachyose/melibiose transport system permease protein